ncbi:MAG: hypothetical protein J6V22_04465 [Clostridia bacterium]|nr:hypothetical protein [Clostridia bacterium]
MKKICKIIILACLAVSVLLMLASCEAAEDLFETFPTTPQESSTPAPTPEGETTPEVTTPTATAPVETTPEATTPEATTPEETTPEETTPEMTTPEDTNDQTPPTDYLASAAEFIFSICRKLGPTTLLDFEVPTELSIEENFFKVEWSVNVEEVTLEITNRGVCVVHVDEESPKEVPYVLTATVIASDGRSISNDFQLTVPKSALTNLEEYIAVPDGENVFVKGIVVAINSASTENHRNSLFLVDLYGKGGYYCYNISTDPIEQWGIEVGMVVYVSGEKYVYAGMPELRYCTIERVDTNKRDVVPFDVTEQFANGDSLTDYVGALVTIQGVSVTGEDLDRSYLYFSLNGREFYFRFASSTLPVSAQGYVLEEIKEGHIAHFGWIANVTGVLLYYYDTPYFIPVSADCIEYIEYPVAE